jgi:hypothetical protein
MPRYNIALIPANNPDQFILCAQTLSNTAPADKYLIGRGASIPHVSLCHFDSDSDQIEPIWQQVQALAIPTLPLTFDHHLSKAFSGNPKYANIVWVSLIPDKKAELKNLHLIIADIIKVPLNSAFEHYDPHMTLFNSRAKVACAQFNNHPHIVPAFEDDFVIVLGATDEVGQLIDIRNPDRKYTHST